MEYLSKTHLRMLRVNGSQILMNKMFNVGGFSFFLPEPGKLSTTMQNDDDGGMSEVVKNVMHEMMGCFQYETVK